ncbi:MAG: DUF2071 domain-containing protein [Pirellulaceae bacterium]
MNRHHPPVEMPPPDPVAGVPVAQLQIDRLSPSIRPAGKPRGYQSWRSLLFLHWPVPCDQLRPLVPEELSLDLYQDTAYLGIVLFGMQDVRHRSCPRFLSFNFLEANVRTYVHYRGNPGIYFLSLDANSRLAVWGARTAWSLPYHHSRMEMRSGNEETVFDIRRSSSSAFHRTRYRLGAVLPPSEPGTLEHFLLERYWLFVRHRGRLCKAQVHHHPYPSQEAHLLEFEDQLRASACLHELHGDPPLVLFSEGVDTEVFGLQLA